MKKHFKIKRGTYIRAYFGGNKAPEAPSYVAPKVSSEQASEGDRTKRAAGYLEDLWEPFYNIVPEQYQDYLSGVEGRYPGIAAAKEDISGQIYDFLPQVNTLSPEFQEQAQQRYDIRKERGLESFGELYDPLERRITGKAFQNFGGLNNSAYGDLQARLADERAEGIGNYVNQLDLQRQTEEAQQLGLQSQSLQNLQSVYGLANLASQEYPQAITSAAGLGGQGVSQYNNIIDAIRQIAIQEAQMHNMFNLGNYQAQLQSYAMQPNWGVAALGAGTSLLGALI